MSDATALPRGPRSAPRFDLTTLGEGQLRLCVPAGTRLERADRFDVFVSGTEGNVASTLARLGRATGWVSALPDSPLGRRVVMEYRLAGVDLGAVRWAEGRLATYYVEYAVPPRSIQVWFDRRDSCFSRMTPSEVDWAYLLDTRLLHLTGISLALPGPQALVLEAAARAREAGVPVSFDMNYRARLWSPEEARRVTLPLLAQLDVLCCSRGDAVAVLGVPAGEPEAVLRGMGSITDARYVVMSMGGDGLMGWDRAADTIAHVPAREVVILDRIGAGDAMVAGVLHGVLGGDFLRGLRYGAVCAALSLSQWGDQLLLDAAELDRLTDARGAMIER
jgi:2-dehydro-3-deoxygluconokinase